VDQLNQNAGGVLSPTEQSSLIAMLTVPSDATQRAAVVRAVAEDQDLKNADFNKAFLLMQYFGYLRRNPNDTPDTNFNGFDFWLTKLNQFHGNFIQAEMVKGFITSIEYKQRSGREWQAITFPHSRAIEKYRLRGESDASEPRCERANYEHRSSRS
jgi:hypothetical protein